MRTLSGALLAQAHEQRPANAYETAEKWLSTLAELARETDGKAHAVVLVLVAEVGKGIQALVLEHGSTVPHTLRMWEAVLREGS